MEKIEHYRAIVRQTIESIAAMIPKDNEVETQLIADDQRGHYLLIAVGWIRDTYRELNIFIHLDVKSDGKVWIQHDGTDQKIALQLIDQGIPKSDIVLGFQSPYRRQFIPDFAVA